MIHVARYNEHRRSEMQTTFTADSSQDDHALYITFPDASRPTEKVIVTRELQAQCYLDRALMGCYLVTLAHIGQTIWLTPYQLREVLSSVEVAA